MFKHYKRSIDFIRDLLKSYQVWIIVIIIETFFISIFSLVLPYLAKLETDQLVQQNTNLYFFTDTPLAIFIYIIGVIIIIELIDKSFTTALSWLREKYTEQFADALFIKMYKRLQYVEIGIYANKRNQDLFDRIL
jgi:ABC-type multidrug transport system fused ATPase/permease subunit